MLICWMQVRYFAESFSDLHAELDNFVGYGFILKSSSFRFRIDNQIDFIFLFK